MKAYVNWPIFTQTSLDSGSLTMLGAVMHNFPEPGEYMGTILHKDEAVGSFSLTVDKESPAAQVDIDLATLHRPSLTQCKKEPPKRYVVNPKGYAVFYVSRGSGGYAVVIGRLQEKGEAKVSFDSRELASGDIFAVTMIRPGTYSVTNVKSDAKGEITVRYPKVGKVPYRAPNPVSIKSVEKRLTPNKVEVHPAQGQVYQIQAPSRIKIELIKPDDGPSQERPKKTRARKKA